MIRPRLLDLFCGAGGAAMGYHRAGFDIVGVDINPQPRYPFEFMQGDALDVLNPLLEGTIGGYTAAHASPPCQDYSKALKHTASGYPRLIDPVRRMLASSGLPWVIENVVGAPLPHQTTLDGDHGLELCGTMFGLRIWRHRLFQTSFPITAPRSCHHDGRPMNPYRADNDAYWGSDRSERVWREEMGVPWMNRPEGREAIPPAYTEHIGRQLLDHLSIREAP